MKDEGEGLREPLSKDPVQWLRRTANSLCGDFFMQTELNSSRGECR